MIKRTIEIPRKLSSDLIFGLINTYYAGNYNTSRKSNNRLNVKRLYRFKSNGWETIIKQMRFEDRGYLQIKDNILSFKIDIKKQLIFSISILVITVLISWKFDMVSFLITCGLIFLTMIIIWLYGMNKANTFLKAELNKISDLLKMQDSIN